MSINPERQTVWQRAKGVVVSAGALATAVIAVVGVWNWLSPRDVQDAASVELALVSRSTLHEYSFQTQQDFDGLPQHPVDAGLALVVATPQPAAPPRPSETAPPTPSPTPQTDQDRNTVPSTGGTMATDPPVDAYQLTEEEKRALALITSVEDVSLDGPSPMPLTSDEVETSLAEALAEVEAVTTQDSVDPLGYRVAVNFVFDGLAGVPLVLTWSLNGVDVSANWRAPRLGIRLEPTTDHDSGSVDIWVPNLSSPGDYIVEVKIVRASGGAALTSGNLLVTATTTGE
ncbi:hypothetical protein QNO21_10080 [Microbacterium sp. zg-Y818]|uniref:hypothetical protein n=1 Tax=unclassified Microbacterium TaxID=2609290 RepID=UPI00214AB228|nr:MULTISPECIES: hypothetical protein [unclassified Microbacterium]MCR2799473.1 hypothetical protein [Microbacterium sp. zg.Y818]WIM21470.1 hypothetical protein QNO21_10080 [Microbacterium sp. zg-Y818]